jgi:chorismate mutase
MRFNAELALHDVLASVTWHVLAAEEIQQELSQLQQALISSEERRLQVGRALLDIKLEHNNALQEVEEQKYEMQQKVLDLEGRVAQGMISAVCIP